MTSMLMSSSRQTGWRYRIRNVHFRETSRRGRRRRAANVLGGNVQVSPVRVPSLLAFLHWVGGPEQGPVLRDSAPIRILSITVCLMSASGGRIVELQTTGCRSGRLSGAFRVFNTRLG